MSLAVPSNVQVEPSSSALLRQKLALLTRTEHSERFWTRPDLREIFPEFLLHSHCIIRASVPLMEAAVLESRARAASDSVARELVRYFEHHVGEEQSHDEWLLDDMEALGMKRHDVL